MKILIFPSEFIDNKGGVPQSTISLVNGLSSCPEYKIIVLCPKESEMSITRFPDNVTVLTTNSCKWIVSKKSIFGTFKTIFDLYKTIKKFLGKDTWFITNQPVTSSLVSFLPYKHIKEIYINRGGNFKDNGVASYIMRKKLKNKIIDYAVGISQQQVDLLISSGMHRDRVFLIHNGLPVPTIKYFKTQLNKGMLRITTIGFISNLKNQIEGIKLVKMLRDNKVNALLNIYGDFDSDKEYKNLIIHSIHDLEVDSYINFCGFVSGEKLYENTDMVISFSRSEGFGRTLVEGMLRYKPIIAWRGAGGPVDITENGKYGHLVENNDASDYFQIIMKLLDNPSYNSVNLEDSYNYACQHFTEDCMVDKYVNLFKAICK